MFGVQGSFDDPSLEGLPKLFGFSPLVYLGALLVPATWWLLFSHPFGVRLRAVGEDAEAASEAAIDPVRMKFAACALCGVLCGLAGGQLALSLVTQWVEGMTAGRGFIALVAIMLARSHPIDVAGGAAVRARLRDVGAAAGHRHPAAVRGDDPLRADHRRARAAGAALRTGCHRMRRVVLDMDVGIDDAIAILYSPRARTPRSSRSAPCTATARREDSARNALVVLETCGLGDVPVALGAEAPLEVPLHLAGFVHGSDGLGDVGFPPPRASRPASTPPTSSSGSRSSTPASSTCSPSARSPTSGSRCSATPTCSRATAPW